MFSAVVVFEVLDGAGDIFGDDDRDIRVGGPGGLAEDVDIEVKIWFGVLSGGALFEAGHLVACEVNVAEHSLKVVCEAVAALGLETIKHTLLSFIRSAAAHEEASRKILFVEGFKDSFTMHEAKEIKHLIKLAVNLCVLVAGRVVIVIGRFEIFIVFGSISDRFSWFGETSSFDSGRTQMMWDGFCTGAEELVDVLGDHLPRFGIVSIPRRRGLLGFVDEGLKGFTNGVGKIALFLKSVTPGFVEFDFELEEFYDHLVLAFLIEDNRCTCIINPLCERCSQFHAQATALKESEKRLKTYKIIVVE